MSSYTPLASPQVMTVSATSHEASLPSFRCFVCLEDVVLADGLVLETCGHWFYQPCIKRCLEQKISDGVDRPQCFHPIGSSHGGVAVADAQIESIVSEHVWRKRIIFLFNKEHTFGRQCPYCLHPQECRGPDEPVCECARCGKHFCFFHSNAHENSDCVAYEKQIAAAEMLVKRISKTCPGCHSSVEKSGGCNHMTCVVCDTNICWLCGDQLEAMSTHFDVASGSSCAGRQYNVSASMSSVVVAHGLVVSGLIAPFVLTTKLFIAASGVQMEGNVWMRLTAHVQVGGYTIAVLAVVPFALGGIATLLNGWCVVDAGLNIMNKAKAAWWWVKRLGSRLLQRMKSAST